MNPSDSDECFARLQAAGWSVGDVGSASGWVVVGSCGENVDESGPGILFGRRRGQELVWPEDGQHLSLSVVWGNVIGGTVRRSVSLAQEARGEYVPQGGARSHCRMRAYGPR